MIDWRTCLTVALIILFYMALLGVGIALLYVMQGVVK